ncbi:GNAT family N-acetyltransferase [Aequorivita sp. H23M31]|uniref:GNAT family N-acetyltransferase n=1 Tax=Aequorivita ciconiae TaxID=2494375 RepID=A0A410G7Q3_9FLAO|nr:GNAT family N-acetyltransferase [Aequorivita sp. H23M31]
MDKYKVRKYQPSDKPDWDSFVKNAKNATFLFHRDFMDYHSDRFEDFSLVVFSEEKLVAVIPANLKAGVLHSHQGLSYGGLVLGKKTTFPEALAIFQSLLIFLKTEGILTLNLKLLPKIYNQLPSDEIDYLLFLIKAKLSRRDLSSCVFNENKLKIESSNRLRGIKKGEKNKLQIREESTFDSFWEEVLEPNLKKVHNQNPVHSVPEINLLKSYFPENIRQFNVYKDNQIVAGTTIFETSEVAHAQYISANAIGRKTGGLDFLFHYLLNYFSNKRYFDFGISNESQGLKVNTGLIKWKESFGGRGIVHDFYEIDTDNHHLLNEVLL